MPPKRKGPLQTVQRDADRIKKQLDSLISEVRQLDISTQNEAVLEAAERCSKLQKSIEETVENLRKLSKADEPAPVGNYDQRKLDEEKRLQAFLKQIQSIDQMLASGTRKAKPSTSQKKEEEESEEEDSDDDDDEEIESEEENQPKEGAAGDYITVSGFKAEQDGDLTVEKGQVLHVVTKHPDGWWLAEDSQGKRGLVPKTFLKEIEKEEDDDDDEDDEEDENTDAGEGIAREMDDKSNSSHKSNWKAVQKAVTEITATEVLAAMGAIPAGFRPSTLSQLLQEGRCYRSSTYIQPQLSQSHLAFKDLFWDPDTGSVRPRVTRVSLALTLWSCRMIPSPGVGVQVLSRHVRLCLFDGAKVLSNIHTVRASYSPNSMKSWTFSPRVTGLLPSLLDGDCFVRSDSLSPNVGILFELGVTYIRNSTGERGDLSCGWTFLRLFDTNGVSIPHRTYELAMHGGTPYERGVDVDPSITRRATGFVFHQMMVSKKLPKLIVKLRTPSTRTRTLLNLLPDTMMGSTCYVPLLALYRQLLADTLLRDRLTVQNADLICNPVLATFPDTLEQTDLMDLLRSVWAERENALKRSEKRNTELLKALFIRTYMDSVFPLLHRPALPPTQWADEEQENLRWKVIFRSSLPGTVERKGLADLLSTDAAQEAFSVTQVTYNFLDPTVNMDRAQTH